MTKFVTDKNAITGKILGLIKPDYTADELRNANLTWWANIRSTGGLGLTARGYAAFTAAAIDCWEFKPTQAGYLVWPKTVLKLDTYLHSPYYIALSGSGSHIKIYDGRIASLIHLYGGLENYLSKLETKRGN